MNDLIGPITNPLHPRIHTRRVMGINHVVTPSVVAEAYRILNLKGVTDLQHGVFIRGFVEDESDAGMDEVSICEGGTIVAELQEGTVRSYRLFAKDFGLPNAIPSEITPPAGMSKGEFSLRILQGEIKGAARDMVLANAALLFYIAGRSNDLKKCCEMARVICDEGGGYDQMRKIQKALPCR